MNATLRVTSTSISNDDKVKVNFQLNHTGEISIEGFIFIDGLQYMDMTPKMVRAYIAKKLIEVGQVEKDYWEPLTK